MIELFSLKISKHIHTTTITNMNTALLTIQTILSKTHGIIVKMKNLGIKSDAQLNRIFCQILPFIYFLAVTLTLAIKHLLVVVDSLLFCFFRERAKWSLDVADCLSHKLIINKKINTRMFSSNKCSDLSGMIAFTT